MEGIIAHLTEEQIKFISNQRVFFVATSPPEGFINLSPKGMDSFRVLRPDTVIWLNMTGSGNETAAHILEDNRMTIMFCAFEGKPMILRLNGHAKAYHARDAGFDGLKNHFPDLPGTRQIFELKLTRVANSCGFGVPHLKFKEERRELEDWTLQKGKDGIHEYWERKNVVSLNNKPTKIFE